jgi:hypothetical protein
MAGNVFEGHDNWTQDNYAALDFERWSGPDSNYKYAGTLADWKADAPNLADNVPATQTAQDACEQVLARAGASLQRDAVDERVINNVRMHQGRLMDSQDQVGGWPILQTLPAPKDSDGDGLPDAWETIHGLNPNDPADGPRDRNNDSYTNLEEYLNSLVP